MASNNYTVLLHDKASRSLIDVATNDGTFVIWLHSFISVIIISACGLIPIVCMPRLQKSRYQNDLLQFLIGLAIGAMTADALLHLLPISGHRQHSHVTALPSSDNHTVVEAHDHDHNKPTATNEDHDHDHDGHIHAHDEGFWFGMMALVGIVGFLVLERLMVLISDICAHSEHSSVGSDSGNSHVDKRDSRDSREMTEASLHQQHTHQNHHQHQHHQLTNETKSFMFMIITGDGLHNFFDGVAIGVSYGSSVTVGISTSIAILCHELPHEIGDFAVLIRAGMSTQRAILYNNLSSILCLMGATTGVFIGKIDVGWVSALIAGMFLYISLVDMVPQLDCYPTKSPWKRLLKLFVQLAGIFLGVAIMSLISIYESKLHSIIS